MLLIFIILLSILSWALRLASVSILAAKQIDNRLTKLSTKGKKSKIRGGLYSVSAGSIVMVRRVIDLFRSILLYVLPIVLVLDIIVFIIISATSAGVVTYMSVAEEPTISIVDN